MENISKIYCPKCIAINYINTGDESDLTIPDVEAVICWHCGYKWLLPGVEDWTDLINANTVEGKNWAIVAEA
mgnify:CR=1 FL=1